MPDDYLWDGKGEPDPDVERLERALRPLRYTEKSFEHQRSPSPKVVPIRPRPRTVVRFALLAAAALAAGAAVVWRASPRHDVPVAAKLPPVPSITMGGVAKESAPAFPVERIEGVPRCGDQPVDTTARLGVGEWLETDPHSRARISVADIGTVEVAGGSRVRLTATGPQQHRLDLDHGAISAKVEAPPRIFVVGTKSATAVDLGCAYTLEVDERGKGMLRVTSGWVSLEDGGRSSFVKAGTACEMRPGKGPGTPWFEDATPALREALARFDFDEGGAPAVDAVLAAARKRDAISVWHLIARTDGPLRRKVIEKLRRLAPPPPHLRDDDLSASDPTAIERWREAITW